MHQELQHTHLLTPIEPELLNVNFLIHSKNIIHIYIITNLIFFFCSPPVDTLDPSNVKTKNAVLEFGRVAIYGWKMQTLLYILIMEKIQNICIDLSINTKKCDK